MIRGIPIIKLEYNYETKTCELIYEKTCEDENEAKDYIIRNTMSKIVHFNCPPTEKFCRKFCFTDNNWFGYRIYFIPPIDMYLLKKSVEMKGFKLLGYNIQNK